MEPVKIIECPRDAWQGLPKIIPTETKVKYLAQLVQAGFRHIDAVSFVSPKYVPQMADSENVLERLNALGLARLSPADDIEIIGIVVNKRGFQRALATPGVTTIGYPYSLSETFSRQNAHMSQAESGQLVEKMQQEIKVRGETGPTLVIYISMAFGNPYGDPSSPRIVAETIQWLKRIGIRYVSLADTVGRARPEDVAELFRAVQNFGTGMEIGVHLHSRAESAAEKVLAAYEAGCRRFDGALTGLGGCPFAGDELVGNIPTEIVVRALIDRGVPVGIAPEAIALAIQATEEIRRLYSH